MTRSKGKVVVGFCVAVGAFFVNGFLGVALCFSGVLLAVIGLIPPPSKEYKLSSEEKEKVRAELRRLEAEEKDIKQIFFGRARYDPDYQKAEQAYNSQFLKIFLRTRLLEMFLRGHVNISEERQRKLENNIANANRELQNPDISEKERNNNEFVVQICTFDLKNIQAIKELLGKNK